MNRILGRLAVLALTLAAVLAVAPSAQAQGTGTVCPTFRVLHDDQIGTVLLPAGVYSVTATGVTCGQASKLFTQFLQDYDGNLQRPWRIVGQGTGRAVFNQGSAPGFSVALIQGPPPTPPPPSPLGSVCPGNFRVLNDDRIGKVRFPRGSYEILIPRGSIITCGQASNLFRRFLASPSGVLPKAWRVKGSNGVFLKPQNPQRKRFRVDPAVGPQGGL